MTVRILKNVVCYAAAGMFLVFSGCKKQDSTSDSETDHSNIIIGFSQIGAESAWRTCNTQSMQQAAAAAGIQLLYDNAEQKQEKQIKAIRSFIVYQVDVIVFVPIVQDGWDNVLKEAKAARIPVIVIDRKIKTSDESLYAGYIGTDSVEEGARAARFLLKKYEGKKGPFNILEVKGTEGSSASEGRYQGFREVLGNDSRFSIIYSESGDFLRSRGKEIAEDILKRSGGKLQVDGKKVDIIFSHNDAMTLGFLEVLDEHGIETGKDITVVTVDAEQAAIDDLKDGRVNCVVECNPKIGPQVMQLVKTLVNRNSIPRLTHVEERVFSEYDDLSDIAARGY